MFWLIKCAPNGQDHNESKKDDGHASGIKEEQQHQQRRLRKAPELLPESQYPEGAEPPTPMVTATESEPESNDDGPPTDLFQLHEDLHEELYGVTPQKETKPTDDLPDEQSPDPVEVSDDDIKEEKHRSSGAHKDPVFTCIYYLTIW